MRRRVQVRRDPLIAAVGRSRPNFIGACAGWSGFQCQKSCIRNMHTAEFEPTIFEIVSLLAVGVGACVAYQFASHVYIGA